MCFLFSSWKIPFKKVFNLRRTWLHQTYKTIYWHIEVLPSASSLKKYMVDSSFRGKQPLTEKVSWGWIWLSQIFPTILQGEWTFFLRMPQICPILEYSNPWTCSPLDWQSRKTIEHIQQVWDKMTEDRDLQIWFSLGILTTVPIS